MERPQNSSAQKRNNIKIFLLYFLLTAGGLWHILGLFQDLMQIMAGPLLIFLGSWLALEHLLFIRSSADKSSRRKKITLFIIWIDIVVLVSTTVEVIGVKSGLIFGSYEYGSVLWPQIYGVPLAIGFAWLVVALSSLAIVQHSSFLQQQSPLIQALAIAFLMMLFDIVMEPAAIHLNYWTWTEIAVPLQNYAAWFVIGFILVLGGQYLGINKTKQKSLAIHTYFAQLIYFLMVMAG